MEALWVLKWNLAIFATQSLSLSSFSHFSWVFLAYLTQFLFPILRNLKFFQFSRQGYSNLRPLKKLKTKIKRSKNRCQRPLHQLIILPLEPDSQGKIIQENPHLYLFHSFNLTLTIIFPYSIPRSIKNHSLPSHISSSLFHPFCVYFFMYLKSMTYE